MMVLRVVNRSDDAVNIEAISLTPTTTSLHFYSADETFNVVLEPAESRDFTIWFNVAVERGSYIDSVDSVNVSITAHSPAKGNFTETTSHNVAVVR